MELARSVSQRFWFDSMVMSEPCTPKTHLLVGGFTWFHSQLRPIKAHPCRSGSGVRALASLPLATSTELLVGALSKNLSSDKSIAFHQHPRNPFPWAHWGPSWCHSPLPPRCHSTKPCVSLGQYLHVEPLRILRGFRNHCRLR